MVKEYRVGRSAFLTTDHPWHWRAGVILEMGAEALMGVDGSEDVFVKEYQRALIFSRLLSSIGSV